MPREGTFQPQRHTYICFPQFISKQTHNHWHFPHKLTALLHVEVQPTNEVQQFSVLNGSLRGTSFWASTLLLPQTSQRSTVDVSYRGPVLPALPSNDYPLLITKFDSLKRIEVHALESLHHQLHYSYLNLTTLSSKWKEVMTCSLSWAWWCAMSILTLHSSVVSVSALRWDLFAKSVPWSSFSLGFEELKIDISGRTAHLFCSSSSYISIFFSLCKQVTLNTTDIRLTLIANFEDFTF